MNTSRSCAPKVNTGRLRRQTHVTVSEYRINCTLRDNSRETIVNKGGNTAWSSFRFYRRDFFALNRTPSKRLTKRSIRFNNNIT